MNHSQGLLDGQPVREPYLTADFRSAWLYRKRFVQSNYHMQWTWDDVGKTWFLRETDSVFPWRVKEGTFSNEDRYLDPIIRGRPRRRLQP